MREQPQGGLGEYAVFGDLTGDDFGFDLGFRVERMGRNLCRGGIIGVGSLGVGGSDCCADDCLNCCVFPFVSGSSGVNGMLSQ